MSNKLSRIYIGAICNRDLEVFHKIKKFCNKNYNISIINLLKKGSHSFNAKHLKKQLRKYPISYIIVKLFSQEPNKEIYNTIKNMIPNIPQLNNIEAVRTCESRSQTFKFIKEKCRKLKIPQSYKSINEAYNASRNGKKIIIKLDRHNIPNLDKDDRIVGVADTSEQLLNLTNGYKDEELFLQEYMGKFNTMYKIYVIGRWVVSITSHNRLKQPETLTPLELIHIRVPVEKQFKRRILRLGRKMGMSVFGIDYVLAKGGIPFIVDVNDFPSFRSIPEATSLISDHIYNVLLVQRQLYGTPIKIKG
ncbi:MAG: hypothetical protein ACXABO_02060 [Promethearchaeota archaeon]